MMARIRLSASVKPVQKLLVRKAAQVEMPDRKGRIVQQVGKFAD